MKNTVKSAPRNRRVARLSVLASACLTATLSWGQVIPADVKPTCTVSASAFAGWFDSGMPTANGSVKPANSITFVPNSNCSFFLWSEQMFLWVTSPAPKTYGGGGGRVFDSPVFFDVSPPDANNVRTLTSNTGTNLRSFAVRVAQKGPHGLPIVFDKAGKMLDVVQPVAGAASKLMLHLPDGSKVEPAQVKINEAGKVEFHDKEGKSLDAAKLKNFKSFALDTTGKSIEVKKIIAGRNGQPIFLNALGQAIDVEQGQAGGNGVLMTQGGSLVYYSTQINDVYAYFLTGAKDGKITPAPTQFPTTQADLNKVIAVANNAPPPYKLTGFPDGVALAIELKSAWVEASTLPNNGAGYITMTATIPTYTKTSNALWTQSGSKQTTLAMLGIHVVGSANGHPEMIWASFEHFGDTPNATYSYNSTSGPKTVTQNTSGTWTFTKNGSAGPFNVEYMHWAAASSGSPQPTIVAAAAGTPPPPPGTISPSDTLRENPWGTPGTGAGSNIALNTDVISINNSVISQLVAGDIRKNYFMIGSTWTNGQNPGKPGTPQLGTNVLANSTMETYQQPNNCFACHQGPGMLSGLSHIYGTNPPNLSGIKPLF